MECQEWDQGEPNIKRYNLDEKGQSNNADTEKKQAACTIIKMQFTEIPSTCKAVIRPPGRRGRPRPRDKNLHSAWMAQLHSSLCRKAGRLRCIAWPILRVISGGGVLSLFVCLSIWSAWHLQKTRGCPCREQSSWT